MFATVLFPFLTVSGRRWPAFVGAILCVAVLLPVASTSESIAQDSDEPSAAVTGPAGRSRRQSLGAGRGDDGRVSDAEHGSRSRSGCLRPIRPLRSRPKPGIQVGALDAIDPDAAGALLPGIEPFPATLWSGSRRSRIEALLPRLPARPAIRLHAAAGIGVAHLAGATARWVRAKCRCAGPRTSRATRRHGCARCCSCPAGERRAGRRCQTLGARIENDRMLAALDLDTAVRADPGQGGSRRRQLLAPGAHSLSGPCRLDRGSNAGSGASARDGCRARSGFRRHDLRHGGVGGAGQWTR